MSTVRRGDIVRVLSERVVDALEGRGDVAATEGPAGLMAVRASIACPVSRRAGGVTSRRKG